MIKATRKISLGIGLILFFIVISFGSFIEEVSAESVKQNDKLIERISKDYTKKFCNGVAFGLSKESAMSFANKENNLIFQNKKGFDMLNKETLATNISISVIENCGYPINLKGQEGIKAFKNDYLLMNNITLDDH